jgi:hypothetical protein
MGVFLLSGVVFARPCCWCGELLFGVGLAVARDCVPPSYHLCLPCNACILGDYQGVFRGSFGWFGLLGRMQQELQKFHTQDGGSVF